MDRYLKSSEIKWEPLGEVCRIVGRIGFRGYTTADLVDEGDGAITLSPSNIIGGQMSYEKCTYISWHKYNESPEIKINNGDVIFCKTASIGKTALIKDLPKQATINPQLVVLKDIKCNNVFLSYILKTDAFQRQVNKIKGVGSVPNLSQKDLAKILIPIPTKEIQDDIARILDSFTGLLTHLNQELTARKLQYIYYLNYLFNVKDNNVEQKPLNEIGEFQRGKRFVKSDMTSEGVPCIHYGEMYTYYGIWADKSKSFLSEDLVEGNRLRIAEKGDVVIVAAGETIDDIGVGTAWLGEKGVVIHDACFSFKSSLNPKYVAYFTRTKHFHDQIKKHVSSGKISAINAKGLGSVIIPIPDQKEQERIVAILDKFNILTASNNGDLPKEIALRNRQYEYYRDMLLKFS